MLKLHARLPETFQFRGALALLRNEPSVAKPCSERFSKAQKQVSKAPNQLDRATAGALVDAGYMPLHRYVELFDERIVTPPYNAGNFGEGEA